MYKLIASMSLVALSGTCNGASTGNHVEEKAEPKLASYTATSFRVEDTGSPRCEKGSEEGKNKFAPPLPELEKLVGTETAEFIVMLSTELSQQDYPLGENEKDGAFNKNTAYMARAQAIAATQLCAIEEVELLKGRYMQSFVLINAFVARLTVEQAKELAQRGDIRSVELSQSAEPPPH